MRYEPRGKIMRFRPQPEVPMGFREPKMSELTGGACVSFGVRLCDGLAIEFAAELSAFESL